MFAVIRTGGKQYKVAKDDVLVIEKVAGDVGSTLTIGEVLMLGGDKPKSGAPLVSGASVEGEIVRQLRGPKLIVFKFRKRKRSRKKAGHRQNYTAVRITGVSA